MLKSSRAFFGPLMEEVPCRASLAPLASLCVLHSLPGLETEGLLHFQGRAGITSIAQWNPRPVIFGVALHLHYSSSPELIKLTELLGLQCLSFLQSGRCARLSIISLPEENWGGH